MDRGAQAYVARQADGGAPNIPDTRSSVAKGEEHGDLVMHRGSQVHVASGGPTMKESSAFVGRRPSLTVCRPTSLDRILPDAYQPSVCADRTGR